MLGNIGCITMQAGQSGIGVVLANKGHLACEALVHHETKRIEIGTRIKAVAAHLLG